MLKLSEMSGCAQFLLGVIFVFIAGSFVYYEIQVEVVEREKDEFRVKQIRSYQDRLVEHDSLDPHGIYPKGWRVGRSDRETFEKLATEYETIIKKHPKWASKYPPIHRMTDEELSDLQKGFDEKWERRKVESPATQR